MCNKACLPNKTEHLNLRVFNMIAWINESKTLTKHISCECKWKFDWTEWSQINSGIMINVDVCVKNIILVKKIAFGVLLHVIVKMENINLASIMDDSAIICEKVIQSYDEKIKSIPTSFNEKNKTWNTKNKTQNFYILLAFFRWGTRLYMSLFLSVCLSIRFSCFISQELYII